MAIDHLRDACEGGPLCPGEGVRRCLATRLRLYAVRVARAAGDMKS